MVKAVKGSLETPRTTKPLTGPYTTTTPDQVRVSKDPRSKK